MFQHNCKAHACFLNLDLDPKQWSPFRQSGKALQTPKNELLLVQELKDTRAEGFSFPTGWDGKALGTGCVS